MGRGNGRGIIHRKFFIRKFKCCYVYSRLALISRSIVIQSLHIIIVHYAMSSTEVPTWGGNVPMVKKRFQERKNHILDLHNYVTNTDEI